MMLKMLRGTSRKRANTDNVNENAIEGHNIDYYIVMVYVL